METEFLGHILTKEVMKPNPNKIKVISNLQLPRSEKQIKSFSGVNGYYRMFIKDYAKVVERFNVYRSIRKVKYVNKYTSDFEKHFTLTTDASNYAVSRHKIWLLKLV